MENQRRARRHLQRAQELLGFGSNLNFGAGAYDKKQKIRDSDSVEQVFNYDGLPEDVTYKVFSGLNGESLGKMRETGKKVRVDEYLKTIEDDHPKNLKR